MTRRTVSDQTMHRWEVPDDRPTIGSKSFGFSQTEVLGEDIPRMLQLGFVGDRPTRD